MIHFLTTLSYKEVLKLFYFVESLKSDYNKVRKVN